MRNPPRDAEIENLLRREARRFEHPRDLDQDERSHTASPSDQQQVRPTAEPPLASATEAAFAPFAQHFKSTKQAADDAAAEKLLEDLARFVDGTGKAQAQPSGSFATRLLTKIKPTR